MCIRDSAYIVGGGVQAIWKDDTIFKEYYPLRHRTGPNIDESKFWEWLGDELPFYSGELVGANLPYDIDGVSYKGVIAPFAVLRDVQWAEALLDEKAEGYRLELLAQKYLNEHKVTNELKELYNDEYIKRFREIHPGHARNYVLGDIDLPNSCLLYTSLATDTSGFSQSLRYNSTLTACGIAPRGISVVSSPFSVL